MTKMTAEMFGANTPTVPDETIEEWLGDEPVMKMTKKEQIQKQIEELQTALKILESEENRRTPCEKAYRDAYGYFPITDSMSGGDGDYIAWDAFQKGWEASRVYHNKYFVIANSKQEEVKKLQEKEWTYKITDEHGESNPYKQGLNLKKSTNLTDLIYDWWEDIFTSHSDLDMETSIDDLVERIKCWFPKPIDETCGLNENDADWNRGYNTYREYLMMQLK